MPETCKVRFLKRCVLEIPDGEDIVYEAGKVYEVSPGRREHYLRRSAIVDADAPDPPAPKPPKAEEKTEVLKPRGGTRKKPT